MTHYMKVCKECEKIMEQCRCPGPKSVTYETCEQCKIKVFEELDSNGDIERNN